MRRRRKKTLLSEYTEIKGRGNKKVFLKKLEVIIVKQVLPLMKNIYSDKFEASCPRVKIGMIYELLFSTLYLSSDRSNEFNINHLMCLFGRLFDQFKIGKHEHEKETISEESSLSPDKIPWQKIDYYSRLYTTIYFAKINYLDEVGIKQTRKLIKNRKRIQIKQLRREYDIDYDRYDLFYNYLDRNRPKMTEMTLPSALQEILIKSFRNSDYNKIIEILNQHGKGDVLGFFNQILNHHLIKKLKKIGKYRLWVQLYAFIYNLALINIRISRDTNTRWVISLSENELSKLFLLYSSFKTSVDVSSALTELYTLLKENWFYPFIPFFPCTDKNNQINWILLPFTLKIADASLINNLTHLIFEDSQTGGDFFEEEVERSLQQAQYSIWDKTRTKKLNDTVRQYTSEKADVDLIVEGRQHYLLIQCKSNSPRRRKTFNIQVMKGKKQLESIFSTIANNPNFFSQILDPKKENIGIILVSTPQPISLGKNPFNIHIISYNTLKNILSESNGKCVTLVENLFRYAKQKEQKMQGKQKKAQWKEIGKYLIQLK